ncbi:YggT family protein [Floricoccus penangensis]|uniref:YggT family protein n=1 Tax=Floricoccus penangensis TaxID=1859475 RepID=UPI001E4E6AC6|nr:YggT family protein [Floricoccus penangensis]
MLNLIFKLIDLYSWVLVIYAMLSWIPPLRDSKVGEIISKISVPYLNLFKGLPLQFGGFDFTVVVGIAALQLIERFIYIIYNLLF